MPSAHAPSFPDDQLETPTPPAFLRARLSRTNDSEGARDAPGTRHPFALTGIRLPSATIGTHGSTHPRLGGTFR
eukprot:1187316-Prorocentrum_minimum.AAC.2